MAKRVAKHVFCGCFVLRYDLITSVLGVRSGEGTSKRAVCLSDTAIYKGEPLTAVVLL
mgnify:CR=1